MSGEPNVAFLDAVRRFSDYHLPSRGWTRVLEVGPGAGERFVLLSERGHAVAVVEPDELASSRLRVLCERRRLETRFLQPAEIGALDDSFDAIVCFEPATLGLDPAGAAASLRRVIRTGGLLLGGPAFAEAPSKAFGRLGFRVDPEPSSGVSVLRKRGLLGRILGRLGSLY